MRRFHFKIHKINNEARMDDSANLNTRQGEPLLSKSDFVGGPIPFVSLGFVEGCCVYGRGPYLVVSSVFSSVHNPQQDVEANEQRETKEEVEEKLLVFPNIGQKVHGLNVSIRASDANSTTTSDSGTNIAVVHGGRRVAFVQHNALSQEQGSTTKRKLKVLPLLDYSASMPSLEFDDWIWDCLLKEDLHIRSGNASNGTKSFSLYVGMAHNTVEVCSAVYNIETRTMNVQKMQRYMGTRRCILYSMCFRNIVNTKYDTIQVASGTVTNEILLWPICEQSDSVKDTIQMVHESHTLRGHQGVIHAVRFHPNRDVLVSASDDRSVRLWKRQESDWVAQWVGWGHTARCWNVVFSLELEMVLSCSEDGTVRLWNLDSQTSGETACVIRGAAGGSYWSVDINSNNSSRAPMIAAGGNDGTVHTYNAFSRLQLTRRTFAVPDDRVFPKESHAETDQPKKKKKKKPLQQVLVGIDFLESTAISSNEEKGVERIRVATRSGSLLELDVQNGDWHWRSNWWNESLQLQGIEAEHGCCMATHTNNSIYAIGTLRGSIVLCRGTERIVLQGHPFLSVQKLAWMPNDRLIAFHVHAVRSWHLGLALAQDSFENTIHMAQVTTFVVPSKGVVTCAAFDQMDQKLAVGDSQGGLHLFQAPIDLQENSGKSTIQPCSTIARLHRKERVNDIVWTKRCILSVGNDGCLRSTRIEDEKDLIPYSGVPLRLYTGIDKIWQTKDDLYLGGYFGNEYAVINFRTGYELYRIDTEGRGRTMRIAMDTEMTGNISVIVNAGSADGLNNLILETQPLSRLRDSQMLQYSMGVNQHHETIFDADLVASGDFIALLTASEDCSSRLTLWRQAKRTAEKTVIFPPQVSGVRAVCCLSIPGSPFIFVAEGGSKQYLRFYMVEIDSEEVTTKYVADGSPTDATEIDHRINCIRIASIEKDSKRCHAVLAGDSNGLVYLYRVEESPRRRIRGQLIFETSRPVFSLEILQYSPSSLCVLVGTSIGEIHLVDLPESLCFPVDETPSKACILHSLKAHTMGTNCISAFTTSTSSSKATFRVASGGDDQSICCAEVELNRNGGGVEKVSDVLVKRVTHKASISAIRGVRWVDSLHLVCSGYGQRVSVWKIDQGVFLLVAVEDTEIGDVNALAAIHTGGCSSVVAVAGIGAQLFGLDHSKLKGQT